MGPQDIKQSHGGALKLTVTVHCCFIAAAVDSDLATQTESKNLECLNSNKIKNHRKIIF